ncbi:SAV_2336 N-terminal domain-related protein [Streptomyces sp. NRRL S-1022]|uniref:SAV_2336 N-terminal domain-related protein n=1 Tax=Streptomyces sp. NRRL S-1022 TaxID=1463880 RepID=UPI00068B9CDD|nr:SAV_2336 N-terminal domain-related protein [Streptomyces sp. NRRL S-1022]
MRSDPPGTPDPLARLADALAGATGGARPTPLELAELLWLARQLDGGDPVTGDERTPAPRPRPQERPPEPSRRPPARPRPRPPADSPEPDPPPAAPPRQPARTPLHLPAPDTGTGRYAPLRAPAPAMIRHPLALQRALRPVHRRTDAPAGHRLDEEATADRAARLGAAPEHWLPVLRPARERWLRLNLVHDTGPTMPVWRPLIRELHAVLSQSGVFRTVTAVPATPDGRVPGHRVPDPADGRTVTLIVSDCMGPQWRPGPAGDRWQATLRRWTRRLPVAVVQPLPEYLWRDTALPAEPGLLRAPFPAAPTAALSFVPYDADPTPYRAPDVVPLPVLEPEPRWVANWAGLLASADGTARPASAAPLGRVPDAATRTDLTRLTPEELVLRFRATASPEAYRLAGHLSLGRPDLPVMRLVQRAVEPDPRPQHLAEVIVGGLLTVTDGPPGSYAFRPGVRELLLRGLPRSSRGRTAELLARVGALIDERAGSAPGEFRAVAPVAVGTGAAGPAAEGEAFATVRPDSVRRLTGDGPRTVPPALESRYRLLRRMSPGGSTWLAEDPETARTVVLRLHRPLTDRWRRAAFLREANALKELRHRNVVSVHDAGIEGDVPYVVMEHLDGIPLNALAAPGGYRLPAPLTVSVGAQLVRALEEAHSHWVRHGAVGMSRVVLLPDGTVKLTSFEPGQSAKVPRDEDLRALGELMLQLAAGSTREGPEGPLPHLPERLRPPYARALTLMSTSLYRYGGALRLCDDRLLARAREAYDQRRSYTVLGPLTVRVGGRSVELEPLAGALLAMLLLRHGRGVTHDELRAGLWGAAEEPGDALAVLGRLASGLRAALGPGVLATLPDGYALHTSADRVDLLRCQDRERRATELAARQYPQREAGARLDEARRLLDEALGLWRDPGPLAGVPGPAARTARNRLLRLRHALYRKRAELDLDRGRYERAAQDLSELLRAYPAREDYRRLLLTALRHLGRLDEALEVFEEYTLSGGRDPELLALGHELRADHDAPWDDTGTEPDDRTAHGPQLSQHPVPPPDELPPGSFPTEEWLPSLLGTGDEDEAVEADDDPGARGDDPPPPA